MCICVVGGAALLGHEGSGRRGPAGAAMPTTPTRTTNDATRGKGQRTTTSNKSGCSTIQGEDDGGNDSGRDVTLRASYSQRRPLRV